MSLNRARPARDATPRAADDSPTTTEMIDKELAEDTATAEMMIKEGERLVLADEKKPGAKRPATHRSEESEGADGDGVREVLRVDG